MNKKEDLLFRPWLELKELQNRRLRHFITHQLYPFSQYYRDLFDQNGTNLREIKTVEDLRRLPFTSKKDFQDSPEKRLTFLLHPSEETMKGFLPKGELLKLFLSKILMGKESLKERLEKEYRPIFMTATAGTTNLPIPFLYTSYDMENLKIYGKRIVEILGIQKDEKALNVFPYAPHLAFWQTVFAGLASNIFILSTGGGKTIGSEGNLKTLLKVKPQYLIGVPSFVYHLLKRAKEEGSKLDFLRCIVLGAARVPKGFKSKLSNLVQEIGGSRLKIFGTYGFTEARCAWVECPTEIEESSGYHIYPDHEVFEVIDPETGEVKGEGEDGELVYSTIDSRGTCVLRYRTGDLVRGGILYSPCPHCGRTVPRISSDIFRASTITKIKDTVVNLSQLEFLLEDKSEIDEWQIEIRKKDDDPYEVDELVLYMSLLNNVNRKNFSCRLNEEVLSSLEVSFNQIHILTHKEIQERIEIETAVKPKKILDHREKC